MNQGRKRGREALASRLLLQLWDALPGDENAFVLSRWKPPFREIKARINSTPAMPERSGMQMSTRIWMCMCMRSFAVIES